MALLTRLKFLRGAPFDPFGNSRHRKRERRLIADYESRMLERCVNLSPADLPELVRLAELPLAIRGYGHVKEASISKFYDVWSSASGASGGISNETASR